MLYNIRTKTVVNIYPQKQHHGRELNQQQQCPNLQHRHQCLNHQRYVHGLRLTHPCVSPLKYLCEITIGMLNIKVSKHVHFYKATEKGNLCNICYYGTQLIYGNGF